MEGLRRGAGGGGRGLWRGNGGEGAVVLQDGLLVVMVVVVGLRFKQGRGHLGRNMVVVVVLLLLLQGGGARGDGVALAVHQLAVAVPAVQLVRVVVVVDVVAGGSAAAAVAAAGTLLAVTFLSPRPVLVVGIVLQIKQTQIKIKLNLTK